LPNSAVIIRPSKIVDMVWVWKIDRIDSGEVILTFTGWEHRRKGESVQDSTGDGKPNQDLKPKNIPL
jgi:hypothetical protein